MAIFQNAMDYFSNSKEEEKEKKKEKEKAATGPLLDGSVGQINICLSSSSFVIQTHRVLGKEKKVNRRFSPGICNSSTIAGNCLGLT